MIKLSLFSGIGGDDLASEWAGIETICFVEIDKYCQKVLRKHWLDIPIIEDVNNVTKENLKELTGEEWVDIISGGDPCQPRSIAGQRRGREDNRDLWPDMFRVIQEFKPTWVINENPTGRLSVDFFQVLSDLESAGYETRSFVIPACAVNAPHKRNRLFIIAYSNNQRKQQPARLNQELRGWSNNSDKQDASNAAGLRLQRRITAHGNKRQESNDKQFDGCGREWDWNADPIEVATRLCRMDARVPKRMDRIKGLGNAVVPQQIYPIYKAIAVIDHEL